ncbi:hypothetical protein E2320_011746, partial [Naja naja]
EVTWVILLGTSALVLAQEGKHGDISICRLFSSINFQPYKSIDHMTCIMFQNKNGVISKKRIEMIHEKAQSMVGRFGG